MLKLFRLLHPYKGAIGAVLVLAGRAARKVIHTPLGN